ncbi:MAG: DEAD/DEAH box helicase [Acidobacteriaceae bacterium]
MLNLRFSSIFGRALISCDSSYSRSLQTLRSRFSSSTSINNEAFELEIDDLLVNLQELAVWPEDDTDIRWQTELLRLVESNAADAATLDDRLAADPDAVPSQQAVFSPRWSGDLTDFQRRDLTKLRSLGHGANFSVPGAGKTRVALAVFEASRALGQVSRLLVVCPKSAFESWEVESGICFANPPLRAGIMTSSVPPITEVVLINYERLPDATSTLVTWLRAAPAMLILDEAHRMKLGPAGAWGSACLALGPYAVKRLILTGTPAPNGAEDLANLFAFVWPGQGRAAVTRALQDDDLRAASVKLRPLFARTTKSQLQLPPVDLFVRRINLPPLHRALYNALLGQASAQWRGGEGDIEALGKILLYLLMAATTPALLATGASRHEPLAYRIPPLQPLPDSTLSELMRDLPHYELSPKYQEVIAIVAANAAIGRKTLVWSTFVRNLKSLESLLARFSPAIVHGGTVDRAGELARFRQDPSCMVLLSNPATLGEGVSLHQVCHDAVYVDRDFGAGRFLQSLDRIHRLGLGPDVETRITILVADQTIDEIVEQRLAAKLLFMGSVLDDPAVLRLGDLDEEPSVWAGMNEDDRGSLIRYLSGNASI